MTSSADRRLRRLATAASPVLLLASVGYAIVGGAAPAEVVSVIGIAGTFLVAGLIAWARRPDNRMGRLMVAAGICESLAPLVGPPMLILAPLGHLGGAAVTVIIGYLVLAFPSGRIESSVTKVLIGLAGLAILLVRIAILVSLDPATRGWTVGNPYRMVRDPAVAAAIEQARLVVLVVVVAALLTLVTIRWARATGPARRGFSPVLVAGLASALVYVVGAVVSLGTLSRDVRTTLIWTMDLSVAFFPIGFLLGLLRIHLQRSAIADLVVELGQTPTPARLRDALANALGDPSLTVAYWSPATEAYVGPDGEPMPLPAQGSHRAVTRLDREGLPMAVIAHDPALLDDPGLVASVASAMRLAVENERLQAEVETQLEEVRASRARIVEAGDSERKRLERDLHDGAQQRLVSLTLALRVAQNKLDGKADPGVREVLEQASEEARRALVDLRELARGIHPAILTEAGLGAAVESLTDLSAIPASVEGATGERFPPTIERTAYFVVSEALANVNKYSGATRAVVQLGRDGAHLRIEVSDDGVGGADATRGSGLRGLADRLSAVDGTLSVESPAGGGTRLVATIPVGPAAADAG